jgi:hypothetical protein
MDAGTLRQTKRLPAFKEGDRSIVYAADDRVRDARWRSPTVGDIHATVLIDDRVSGLARSHTPVRRRIPPQRWTDVRGAARSWRCMGLTWTAMGARSLPRWKVLRRRASRVSRAFASARQEPYRDGSERHFGSRIQRIALARRQQIPFRFEGSRTAAATDTGSTAADDLGTIVRHEQLFESGPPPWPSTGLCPQTLSGSTPRSGECRRRIQARRHSLALADVATTSTAWRIRAGIRRFTSGRTGIRGQQWRCGRRYGNAGSLYVWRRTLPAGATRAWMIVNDVAGFTGRSLPDWIPERAPRGYRGQIAGPRWDGPFARPLAWVSPVRIACVTKRGRARGASLFDGCCRKS